MSKKDETVTAQQWIDKYTKFMALETHKLVKAGAKTINPRETAVINTRIMTQFIGEFLTLALYETLTSKPKKDKVDNREVYEHVHDHYKQIKGSVAEEVGLAFRMAMSKFTGQQVDYYCQIMLVPEPINKEPI